ncbi:Adenylate kinase [Halomicrobium zhouii]|uniref:Adenylate kinase n=1 Tax=Halomicrobium zhouii TaxID=767519 RepID=A0A1I6KN31_9EURY|nr:adenylate kinase [Halomicrobium zhouii]SFR92616.1 Adenylate kinase [Halomicrobium zhouii]
MASPRILILGPPGAGKGTQSSNIAEEYDVEHVTTGDALRSNKGMDISDMDTEYDTPGEYMDAGDLVPDEVVNAIVDEALSQADGFVLDGYPRNLEQAEELEGMTDLDVVLSLDVDRDVLVDRLTGRRVDPETGENYHVEFNMPDDEDVRDRLVQREDDNEESVRNRLDVFEENTAPVIDHYEDHDGFVAIDGEQTPDDVWADIQAAIDERV